MAKSTKKNQKQQNIDFSLFPKQGEALKYLQDDVTKQICYGGGSGGGKSLLGCAWVLTQCIKFPGVRYLIGRARLSDLKTTTIATLFEVLNDKWKLDKSYYNYNQQDNILRFNNGSEILFKDLAHLPSDSEYTRLAGLELTGFFADEANQISEKCFNILNSRIRYKLDENNLIPKALITCNPNRSWIFEKFYKLWKNNVLPVDRKFIPALVYDNPFVSKHYVAQLENTDQITRERLLKGNWEYTDDYCLFDYDSVLEIFNSEVIEQDEKKSYYLTIDVARLGKDNTVMMVWHGCSVIDCITISKKEINTQLSIVNRLKSAYGIANENVCIDADGVGGGLADFVPGCVNFMNGSKAINGENFYNLKTQCYYLLKKYVSEGKIKFASANMNTKNFLIQELMNIKAKGLGTDRKLQISSKEEIKRAISRSPDYSDCMMMRMYFNISQSNLELQPTGEYYFRVGSIRR